ncbi:hypothetical protein GRF29_161g418892 [Pseudopithomyces chartarum]|uniref:Uncharacterized protein n=1 Tax=Pseudopithomyces chartarum TaxID=1892770 RepID=A0AAN6RE31_9PLEO|nr:hypothetical protein GRF29_161g418892 [Pseudopithomyces chartarum]
MASQNPTGESPTRMAATAASTTAATAPTNESSTAMDATPTAAASTSEPPTATDTAAMDTTTTDATTANTTATDTNETDTTTLTTPPSLIFLTPTSLLSHLTASLPLLPNLTLHLGTSHPLPSSLHSITDRLSLIDDETTAWAQALVRITKLPDFPLRTIIFHFDPSLKDGLGSPAIHRLFTRASAAVWKRERGMGRSVSEVVFGVMGWKEGGGGGEVVCWGVGCGFGGARKDLLPVQAHLFSWGAETGPGTYVEKYTLGAAEGSP